MILNESKRDDLLLPYVEMLNNKGIKCTLGQLKSFMLKKLTNEARMRNLSLGSNFYLAGAVRYYFNGDLTFNKDLSVFKDEPMAKDEWNDDVCQRLNALINILRNSYIDSIGETFEQPEDFGTLTLPKLLRKYNKKINIELGNENVIDNNGSSKDNLNRDDNVGNGYTFDILYSYKDARKYNKATEPGAWCITYGEQHYKNYIKNLGIHYVIFKQNGYENVPRVKGPDWTYRKPQDKYGCSLIALLQSNKNGEPVYITSRWNHGYGGDNSHCEADHAFTKEEFMEKTGVTDADLQRIFEIWKTDHKLKGDDDIENTDKISKEEKLKALRTLKYTQMRINGGDVNVRDSIKIIRDLNGTLSVTDYEDAKINKSIYWCKNSFDSDHTFYFLVDKGKIIFETLSTDYDIIVYSTNLKDYDWEQGRRVQDVYGYENLVIIAYKKYVMLYDMRRHTIINIDGVNKFKGLPLIGEISDNKSTVFYQLSVGKYQSALLNLATNTPLKLPNGSMWVNSVTSNGTYALRSTYMAIGNTNLHMKALGGGNGCFIEIVYDNSSGERYFYDVDKKRFLNPNELPQVEQGQYLHIYNHFNYPGYMAYFTNQSIENSYWGNKNIVLLKNGQRVNINGKEVFSVLTDLGNGLIGIRTNETREPSWSHKNTMLYNLNTEKLVLSPETNEPFLINYMYFSDSSSYDNRNKCRFIFIRGENCFRINSETSEYIFDKKTMSFIKNPINFPSEYQFYIQRRGNDNGEGVVFAITNDFHSPYTTDPDIWRNDYCRLYVPGIENKDIYDTYYGGYWSNLPLSNQLNMRFNNDDVVQMVTEIINRIMGENL